jgi:hypothetical protein
MNKTFTLLACTAAVALTACSTTSMKTPDAPAAVTVPAGNKVVMSTVGIGQLTYECRVKANMAGTYEWVLAGPDAVLYDGDKKQVGKYYAGPTWESMDGSKVTGKQLAVSPNPGSIPLQLVQANPATGNGAMTGITYIQRLDTKGGVAPTTPCGGSNVSEKQLVKYQADYVFYKAAM